MRPAGIDIPGILHKITLGTHEIILNTTNGYGSTGIYIRRWTNVERNVGTAMTLTQSATDGDSITINVAGIYGMCYVDNFTGAQQFGISVNGAIATMFHSLAQANVITREFSDANYGACCAATRWLAVNDVIRAHTQGTAADTAGRDKFSIVLLSKG